MQVNNNITGDSEMENNEIRVRLLKDIASAINDLADEINEQKTQPPIKSFNIILKDSHLHQKQVVDQMPSNDFVEPIVQSKSIENHQPDHNDESTEKTIYGKTDSSKPDTEDVVADEITISHATPTKQQTQSIEINDSKIVEPRENETVSHASEDKEELTVAHPQSKFVATVGKSKKNVEAKDDLEEDYLSMDELEEKNDNLAGKINKDIVKKVLKGVGYTAVGVLSVTGVLAISGFLLHVKPAQTVASASDTKIAKTAVTPVTPPPQTAPTPAQNAQTAIANNPVQDAGTIQGQAVKPVNASQQPLSENTPPPKPDQTASNEPPKPSPILPDPRLEVVMGHAKDSNHKLYVFSDPVCPYCKKLEPTLEKASADGYEVHIFPTPVHPEAFDLIKSVACSKNKKDAWLKTVHTQAKAGAIDCKDVEDVNNRSLRFFSQFGFNATPTLVNINGVVHVGGFNTYQDFVAFANQPKN